MMLGGIQIPDPEEGWLYLEAAVLIKCMDSTGNIRYREIRSNGLTEVEALGMATTFADTLKMQIMRRASGGS